jgi:LmbE family N-acetylglucosaminyl deacetylase
MDPERLDIDRHETARSRSVLVCLAGLLLLPGFSLLLAATPPELEEDQGLTGFGLALRRLPTTGSLLYITAHPDDENNAVLAKVSRGLGIRTALLSLTRGDGGQNEIGPELFEALGVLRTQELMRVHRFDGASQYFTRAYEFGYSFSVEETLERWGEEVLRDVVRVIREFRPDVILTLNPRGAGGGQHHQASARLAARAFELASDDSRFPEQIEEGLRAWRPSRLFQAPGVGWAWGDGRSGPGHAAAIEVGDYDPLLGESYAEFGARARSSHRCQGMNILPEPGSRTAYYRLVKGNTELKAGTGFFGGLDISWGRVARHDPDLTGGLESLRRLIRQIRDDYAESRIEQSAAGVMQGLALVRELAAQTGNAEARFLLRAKEQDLLAAAGKGNFIYLDALVRQSRDGRVNPGEEVSVQVRFLSRSGNPARLRSVQLSGTGDWNVRRVGRSGSTGEFRVTVPAEAGYTQPYWFRRDSKIDLFSVRGGFSGVEAVSPPALKARVTYVSDGVEAGLELPVQYRWFDPVIGGERRRELQVVPEVTLGLEPEVRIFVPGAAQGKTFHVRVENERRGSLETRVELLAPEGWRVQPRTRDLSFRREGETATVTYEVEPPQGLDPGSYRLEARARVGARTYSQGYRSIDYHHVETRHLYRQARSLVQAFDVKVAPVRVGYVMGVGDQVPAAIEDLGLELTYLDASDLAEGDLSGFDVIVTGVRAYERNQDLRANNDRLLEYVENGGTVIVQYNRFEFNRAQYGPRPALVSRNRVTDEAAPVRVLAHEHPVFAWPNPVDAQTWSGWVQERGLYFLGEKDPAYVDLVELEDSFEWNPGVKRGALVETRHGRGRWLYLGLGLWRQLPAGTAGAYQLLANLLSLGALE